MTSNGCCNIAGPRSSIGRRKTSVSQQQLAAEVKSIYSGLTIVEARCIHLDKAQAAAIRSAEKGETELIDDHWKALIAIHRKLLREHHDFFLASQHPSAPPALRRLAANYSMPARMWKHGIHSFLELLRYSLPDSLEYMISFIYFAYQMMSLLYETVPAFEDAWIECLGDLGRYRMAIGDEDFRDRETWAGVARFWYSKAADRSPGTGRLYHHLAILARPNALQQLYLYCRSLTAVQPFQSARDSITTLFDSGIASSDVYPPRTDTLYLKLHRILCLREDLGHFDALLLNFLTLLQSHITAPATTWQEEGSYVAISIIAALFDYGSPGSSLRRLVERGLLQLRQRTQVQPVGAAVASSNLPSGSGLEPGFDPLSRVAFHRGFELLLATTRLVLRNSGAENALPFVNGVLTFALTLASVQPLSDQPTYASEVLDGLPWGALCLFANILVKAADFSNAYENTAFPIRPKGDMVPLPEDRLIRGQIWAEAFFPTDWWEQGGVNNGYWMTTVDARSVQRSERVFWIMCRIASVGGAS
jgi:Est1 DNA/RNA binding domain